MAVVRGDVAAKGLVRGTEMEETRRVEDGTMRREEKLVIDEEARPQSIRELAILGNDN